MDMPPQVLLFTRWHFIVVIAASEDVPRTVTQGRSGEDSSARGEAHQEQPDNDGPEDDPAIAAEIPRLSAPSAAASPFNAPGANILGIFHLPKRPEVPVGFLICLAATSVHRSDSSGEKEQTFSEYPIHPDLPTHQQVMPSRTLIGMELCRSCQRMTASFFRVTRPMDGRHSRNLAALRRG